MSIVYVPRLIETAEQAERLPVGTIAMTEEFAPEAFVKDGDSWLGTHGPGAFTSTSAVGLTALVPIEAEEEHKGIQVFPRPDDAPWPPGAAPNQDTDGRWYFIDEDDRSVGLWGYAHPFHDAMVAWLDAQPSTTRLVTPWEAA